MPWDPNISFGNILTIGSVVAGGIISFVKMGAAVDAVKVDLQQVREFVDSQVTAFNSKLSDIAKDTKEQGRALNGADKLFEGMSKGLVEKMKAIDEALAYNSTWRHDVAGAFMRETGLRVQELDMSVARLEMRVASLGKEVEVVQITLRSMRGNQ